MENLNRDLEAEIARLRKLISDQEDSLRYGEESCARLVAERDDALWGRDAARASVRELLYARETLTRIAAAMSCVPDDDDDLVEAVRLCVRERDDARRDLGEILAVIHRDGGHHTDERGLSQSVADAHATWASVVRDRDEARAQVKAWQAEELSRRTECDEARAEVERRDREHEALVETAQKALAYVTAERDEALSRVAAEAGKDLAAWAADLDAAEAAHARLVAERDEARAEVERLRDAGTVLVRSLERMTAERDKLSSERRQLRARLVECRPWVGVLPYPNTPKFSEMLAIRDLADDTLEEVQP